MKHITRDNIELLVSIISGIVVPYLLYIFAKNEIPKFLKKQIEHIMFTLELDKMQLKFQQKIIDVFEKEKKILDLKIEILENKYLIMNMSVDEDFPKQYIPEYTEKLNDKIKKYENEILKLENEAHNIIAKKE